MMDADIMTLEEVAKYLKLQPQTVYKWAQDGQIPGAKLGKELPDDYAELDARADLAIRTITKRHPRAGRIYELLLKDKRVNAHWNLSNYLTVGKLNYNDHGPIL